MQTRTARRLLAVVWYSLLALLIVLHLAACDSLRPEPAATRWTMIPMSEGPALWTACVHGVRLFALQALPSRGRDGLWPGASITRGGHC